MDFFPYSRGVQHKARGPEPGLNPAHWTSLENVKEGCIFISFTASPSDKDLPHGLFYYTKVTSKI